MIGHFQRVYHFRSDVHSRDLETVLASRLYCAKVTHQNDPFEFVALQALDADPIEQQKYHDSGIACFCRALTSPLLWSHYANKHQGFAVGYDTQHPFFGGLPGGHGRTLFDVKYEDVPPSRDRYTNNELVSAALFTKPTCWAYEQEVRFVYSPGDQAVNVPREAVKEIVFGLRMNPDRVSEIKRRVSTAGFDVRFAQMRSVSEGYAVTPSWIELAAA